MPQSLFDSLARVHRYDDLEGLLDFVCETVVSVTGWATALITFYFGDEVFFGTAGCPEGTKRGFRQSFLATSPKARTRKRGEFLEFQRPGTNICFVPAGRGPQPASAFVLSPTRSGSWQPKDRMVVVMRDWEDEILGMLSLDNPRSGSRPDEEEFRQLEEVDRYVNVVAKIAENRFWALRLQESEEAYRAIFDAATDGLLITDIEGRIVEANPAVCRMHGYDHDELVGLHISRLMHSAVTDHLDRFLCSMVSDHEFQAETDGLRKDETAFDAEIRCVVFHYRGHHHLLAIVQDVTERKRILQHMLDEQKEESIVAVAGGVAHDFNNILMGITGSASLLRRDLPLGSEALRHCDRVATSAGELSRLTGQLLAIAQGVHSQPRPVLLGAVVRENLALVGGLVGSSFVLDVDVEDDAWPVHADRVQLAQVILNLAQNACEAMEHGGRLRISIGTVSRTTSWTCPRTGPHPPGDYVRLRVEDNGLGMDDETKKRLFDPYFSTKPDGSGLGLAAVLGIVRRHHGALHLESEPGHGTMVEILLPRCDAPAADVTGKTTEVPSRLPQQRILVVEDDDIVREVVHDLLRTLHWDVIVAESGRRALEIFEEDGTGFDLVLLDVSMPGMSGVKTHEALARLDPEVRVLFTSGHTEHLVREDFAAEQARIAGFLQKPYTLEGLEAALDRALEAGTR